MNYQFHIEDDGATTTTAPDAGVLPYIEEAGGGSQQSQQFHMELVLLLLIFPDCLTFFHKCTNPLNCILRLHAAIEIANLGCP